MNNIASQIVRLYSRNNKTISFAESCTGGLLSHLIISEPGASKCFYGSIVSYSNEAKIHLLGVSEELINKYGAVSREVCSEMAKCIRLKCATNIGLSITGIAGPDGGSKVKPVGTVWIGVSIDNQQFENQYFFEGNRDSIRQKSAEEALNLLMTFARA